MRILTAIDVENPDLLEDASIEIWKEIWSHDRDITDNSILTSALVRSGIPDKKVRHYFETAEKPEIKKRLKDVTKEAISAEAFGAPTFILRQEGNQDKMFFGQDRIELLCAAVNKKYYGPALAGKK